MAKRLRVGLIGLDTSHTVAFTKLLNDPGNEHHVGGAKVTAGFPGGSSDFHLSASRVAGFTRQLKEDFGVEILDSPEAVAERVDLVFITAVDGRAHRELFERTAGLQRPTFIDKPLATSLADAKAIIERAGDSGIPVMSCSALRYADNFQAALVDDRGGGILGCDAFGPMALEEALPGLFWYGVHCVEMVVAAMGVGCRRVCATRNDDFDLIAAEWADGRMACIRGMRRGHGQFGAVVHREKEKRFVDIAANDRPYYAGMLEAIIGSLSQGRSAVPAEEMLQAIALMEAANEARETGRPVLLPD